MSIALSDIELNWNGKVSEVLFHPYVAKMAMPLNQEMSGQGIGMMKYKGLAWAAGYGGRTDVKLKFDKETPHIGSVDYTVPKQMTSRYIDRGDWEAYLLRGIDATNGIAVQMLGEVQDQQNYTVLQGWAPDGINYVTLGMYQVAANSDAGSSFGTYKGALTTVGTLIGKLQQDKIYSDDGYNLFINPVEKMKLVTSGTNEGIREWPQVLDALNEQTDNYGGVKPGRIISTPCITAGTCMVAPVASEINRKYFELIEPQTVYNNIWYEDGNSKDGNIRCRQVASLFPTFPGLNSSNKTDAIAIGTTVT
ncbi:MAG: hypothetical protein WCS15_10790 [Prevotella sp.]